MLESTRHFEDFQPLTSFTKRSGRRKEVKSEAAPKDSSTTGHLLIPLLCKPRDKWFQANFSQSHSADLRAYLPVNSSLKGSLDNHMWAPRRRQLVPGSAPEKSQP